MKDLRAEFPAGSLVRFQGDAWLDDIRDNIGLIVEHTFAWGEPAIKVLIKGKQFDLPVSEIELESEEIIRVDI